MIRYSGMIMNSNDKYTIYSAACKERFSISGYFICLPKEEYDNYSLCIGFPSTELDYSSKDSIINEIDKKIARLNTGNIIYVLPVIDKNLLLDENSINDDKLYKELIKALISLAGEVFEEMINHYHKMMEQGMYLVIDTEFEDKFFDWLSFNFMINNSKYKDMFWKATIKSNKIIENPLGMGLDDNNSDGSGNMLSGGNQDLGYDKSMPKVKVKKNPILSTKHGFSNIWILGLIIIFSLVIGIGFSYLVLN